MENKRKKTRSNSMRRFLRDVLKPTPSLSTLGKRERTEDAAEHKDPAPHPNPRRSETPSSAPVAAAAAPACVALQNEDLLEDAIVITALTVAPFCCHADLITMSRTQLLTVAAILNAKLPRALQIDVGPACSDVAIRYAIEVLVGLRDNPPPPPPSASSLSSSRFTLVYGTPTRPPSLTGDGVSPRPPSPPTRRSRASMSLGSPALPIVHEDARERESEPAHMHAAESERERKPPQKKRRTDAPITRALSHRIAPFLAHAAASSGEDPDPDLSGSQDSPSPRVRGSLPLARTLTLDGTAYPYPRPKKSLNPSPEKPLSPKKTAASRGASGPGARHVRARSLKAYMTSTPKRRGAAINSPEVAHRFRSLLADAQVCADRPAPRGGGPADKVCREDTTIVNVVVL